MPAPRVEAVERSYPGWTLRQLRLQSAAIDSLLRKRYAAPFAEPYPPVIQQWLTRLVTPQVYLKGGISSSDEQFSEVRRDAERAQQEILDAADAERGRADLPLRADTATSGIVKQAPQSYSEASPYTWRTRQAVEGRIEDRHGR
jgi:hypothetical protein